MTSEGGRTASNWIMQRAWFGTGKGQRPMKTLDLGGMDGVQKGGIASSFGCTQYSRLKYTPLTHM